MEGVGPWSLPASEVPESDRPASEGRANLKATARTVKYDPDAPEQLAAREKLHALEADFAALSEADVTHFENLLYLWCAVRGWTGRWDSAPETAVLAAYEQMLRERPQG